MNAAVTERYVASRYLSLSHAEDGALVLHCSRTGAVGVVPPEDVELARTALLPNRVTQGPLRGVLADLESGGFLIAEGTDEKALAHENYIYRYTDDSLHLIVMPTEQCNFRCVYCYESIKRPEMSPGVRDGIKKFVAGQERLNHLAVSWFGGEPLLAPEVVFDVTNHLRELCEDRGTKFYCLATTNGYFLTPEYADRIIPAGLRQFQITLDGVAEEHDRRRVGAKGEKTFDRIWENLRYLHSTDHDFLVMIRHNFDPDSLPRLPEFLDMLRQELAGDPRFTTELTAIGKWGGPNDAELNVCDGRDLIQSTIRAKQLASAAGFRDALSLQSMQPNGSVCYAANPRSFVIGPDGSVYKCTVELDYHDRNVVGQLHPDGVLDLDWHKMALWCETDGSNGQTKCTSCYFNPACHGAVCPKEWMDGDECECPAPKHTIRDTLTLIRTESLFTRPDTHQTTIACTRG